MRFNLKPALVLQAFALVIVVGYFWSAGVHQALDVVGALKLRYGYAYSALATCVFGGLIRTASWCWRGAFQRSGAIMSWRACAQCDADADCPAPEECAGGACFVRKQ